MYSWLVWSGCELCLRYYLALSDYGHGHTDQLAHAGATPAVADPDFDTWHSAAGSFTSFSTTTPNGKAVVSDQTAEEEGVYPFFFC